MALKFTNNSDTQIEIFISDTNKTIRNALPAGVISPHNTNGVGVTNYPFDKILKDNHFTKMYITKYRTKQLSLGWEGNMDSLEILKIIILKKDSIEAIGWKMEYP